MEWYGSNFPKSQWYAANIMNSGDFFFLNQHISGMAMKRDQLGTWADQQAAQVGYGRVGQCGL